MYRNDKNVYTVHYPDLNIARFGCLLKTHVFQHYLVH